MWVSMENAEQSRNNLSKKQTFCDHDDFQLSLMGIKFA